MSYNLGEDFIFTNFKIPDILLSQYRRDNRGFFWFGFLAHSRDIDLMSYAGPYVKFRMINTETNSYKYGYLKRSDIQNALNTQIEQRRLEKIARQRMRAGAVSTILPTNQSDGNGGNGGNNQYPVGKSDKSDKSSQTNQTNQTKPLIFVAIGLAGLSFIIYNVIKKKKTK